MNSERTSLTCIKSYSKRLGDDARFMETESAKVSEHPTKIIIISEILFTFMCDFFLFFSGSYYILFLSSSRSHFPPEYVLTVYYIRFNILQKFIKPK